MCRITTKFMPYPILYCDFTHCYDRFCKLNIMLILIKCLAGSIKMDEARKKEMQQLNIQVGSRLREIRERNGYTQEQFAETLNISEVHYRKLENGRYRIVNENLVKLYQVYRIDPTYLLVGETGSKLEPDYYLTNCSAEERENFLGRMFAYIMNFMKND